MRLVNLTPHPLVLCDAEGNPRITLAPAGAAVRCKEQRTTLGNIRVSEEFEIPMTKVGYGDLAGLPDPAPETMYVVSVIAASAVKAAGRDDILITDLAVRDETGRITGCRALARP